MATAPMIESIYQNYGQNQCDVVVLSFNITNPATNAECDNFATTYGSPSPPNFNYTEASWYQFYSVYGGSFAQTYVVTPNGNSVIYSHAGGVLNQSALESVLNNELTNYSSSISSTTITACNSYTWNGITYITSGSYTYSTTNANGCDSTATLNLTINNCTLGCTDPFAMNFDPLANVDDGSCWYNMSGCTDSTAVNYNPTASIDDGSCQYSNDPININILTDCFGTISNVSYLGDTNQIAEYSGYNFLGLDSGIVLSTGDVNGLNSPTVNPINNPYTDNDLLSIANSVPPLIGQSFTVAL